MFTNQICLAEIKFVQGDKIDEKDMIETMSDLRAEAGFDKSSIVNRQISFSASASTEINVFNVKYCWEFGDGVSTEGEEVVHVYKNSGVYRAKLIIRADSGQGLLESFDEIIVNVDRDVVVLITDQTVDEKKQKELQSTASPQGILIFNIQETTSDVDYVVEKELAQKILKNEESLNSASLIVIWTKKNIGLNAFVEAGQILGKTGVNGNGGFSFGKKSIVVITDQNFSATARVAQSLYNIVSPQFIVLTDQSASSDIFSTVKVETLLNQLREKELDYKLVGLHTKRQLGVLRPWNFLSFLVSYMVDKGVSLNTIYLILVLPLIATIVAFSRQVLGFKALGIYTPSIIAVAFLVTGLKYGLVIFLVTLLVGTLGRFAARSIRLSYLPRMANVLILVCLAIFVLFFLGAYFEKQGLIDLSIFPILIMVLLTEKFVSVQIERGSKTAIILVVETLFLSMACYWLANWPTLRTLILAYPEFILLTIVLNLFIGRWTGLRLLEYYRFRKVIKNVELAEKK